MSKKHSLENIRIVNDEILNLLLQFQVQATTSAKMMQRHWSVITKERAAIII